ncbi:MAG: hypothetical protein AAGG44_12175 [Planctomycetota bacterium]
MRTIAISYATVALLLSPSVLEAQEVEDLQVPSQPLLAQAHRLSEALDVVGRPLSQAASQDLDKAKKFESPDQVVAAVQQIFDPMCLVVVDVPASGPPSVSPAAAKPELLEQGWRTFLVKVINRHGRTGRLFVESPNARPLP